MSVSWVLCSALVLLVLFVSVTSFIHVSHDNADIALFSYGTLQYGAVQFVVAGRSVPTQKDALCGYKKAGVLFNGTTIVPTANNVCVEGVVMMVTKKELAAFDAYESLGRVYERKEVQLASGKSAFVYQKITP